MLLGSMMLPLHAMAQSSGAQPAQDEASPRADDIVVTAQGREQRLQDVPVAVSIVSGLRSSDRTSGASRN
jgi:outer membrane cobalamin receptor